MRTKIEQQFQGFLLTPPLWLNKELFSLKQFHYPRVNIPGEDLITSLLPGLKTNYVLGKRMESYFGLGLILSKEYAVVGNNLQIINNGVTLGEIDFLLHNVEIEKPLHVEVVFKFYIYDPSFKEELERWIGPNRKDTLLQKVSKLQNKQLPLLFREESSGVLKDLNISLDGIQQEVCFKASLFIPGKLKGYQFPEINNLCIAGSWISMGDFTQTDYGDFEFYLPVKQDWPIPPQYNKLWKPYSDITEEIAAKLQKKTSPLVWIKKPDATYERMFIVWW